MLAFVADLDDQYAVVVQPVVRLGDDTPHDVHAVVAARERHLGLMAVFGRQLRHRRRVDIRRVRQDHVVARVGLRAECRQRRIQIAAVQRDPVFEAVVAHVDLRDFERIGRQIDRVDFGVRERARREDREAARARAELEHRADLLGIGDVWLQPVVEQLADERTRHDHALVDVEAVAVHPRFARQIGGRHALGRASLDHREHGGDFVGQQPRVEERFERVERQVERMQHEIRRFVIGVVRAVTESELRFREARHGVAQQVANGGKRGRHARLRQAISCSSTRRYTFFSGSTKRTSICSSILWMLPFGGPNSITCGQMRAMKRPSDVPPVVDSSVVRPVSARIACSSAFDSCRAA